jgi:hypothetical protein
MRSRKRRTVFSLLIFPALAIGGCAIKQPPPPDAVSHAPLVVDEAMQNRQWPVSVAQYANGETNAWATGFILIDRPNAPVWEASVTETPIFVANVLACPIVFLATPAWQPVIYPRGITEPSYTAQPPLPPE